MEFPFRKELVKETKSYANNTPHVSGDTLDCSLGVNPYGYPEEIDSILHTVADYHLSDYPHTDKLSDAILSYWKDYGAVEKKNLSLCNGSVCGLYTLNNIFSQSVRNEAVGPFPTFTDMVESVRAFGMTYTGVPMKEDGKMDIDGIIASLSDRTAFVYIDTPNNPTGQTVSLSDIRRVLDAAKKNGSFVIMDEAYGDFVEREESSIRFFKEYDNLIVVRTFSKGFGLANLRGGYIFAPGEITGMLLRTSNPYVIGEFERSIFAEALSHPDHPSAGGKVFSEAKEEIIKNTGKNIRMLYTDPRVPICTLELMKPGNLQHMLLKEGILTVSGLDFELLNERFVRLRLPKKEDQKKVISAVLAVENLLF